MTPREVAQVLLRKASQDEVLVRSTLENDEVADEIVAFHAQQAVEKCLKAILTLRGVPYERTHDLSALVGLIEDQGLQIPSEMIEAEALTPFAALFRYAELPADEDPVDRPKTLRIAETVRIWAENLFDSSEPGP